MPIFTLLILMGSFVGVGQVQALDYCGALGAYSPNPEVNTAFGCVPVEMNAFAQWMFPKMFGIAGGISFLLMIYGFIKLGTSGSDPKAAQGAQETITSAIMGLLVSVFSLFLLRLITIGILKIPGIS